MVCKASPITRSQYSFSISFLGNESAWLCTLSKRSWRVQTAENASTYPPLPTPCCEVKKYPRPICTFLHCSGLSHWVYLYVCVLFYISYFLSQYIAVIKSKGSEASLLWVQIPTLPVTSCVALLRFPHLCMKNVSGICLIVLGGLNEMV